MWLDRGVNADNLASAFHRRVYYDRPGRRNNSGQTSPYRSGNRTVDRTTKHGAASNATRRDVVPAFHGIMPSAHQQRKLLRTGRVLSQL
jgi:hypothetical protein